MATKVFQSLRHQFAKGSTRNYAHAGSHEEHVATARRWKLMTYFLVPPALLATWYNAFYISEHHQRPEYIEYDHLRIRTKAFPWGDGNHTLFHNPEMNAVPGVGYEADPPHH
ncbi:COX6A1 [Bugula neritina]|uniref:Cytochrome c oxidase subunit n=1 Tax=Bugula neritina TaxID=10212 RepID=A0A7J7KRA9_BUGNE|nr:COX6A1 [Bugula neritina]